MSSEWIWFDLDDTLVDFHANSRAAHRILFDECGLGRYYASADEWIDVYEMHNHDLWARYGRAEITQEFLRVDRFATPLRPHWDGCKESLIEFSKALDPLYLGHLAEQTVLIDGAVDLLTHLRAHDYNIGILSNGFKDVQHRKLANTGLDRLVDLTVLSDDIGINKPDPRLYGYAMRQSGTTAPEMHTMIGDNLMTDIEGAIRAGWHAIHLDPSAGRLEQLGKRLVTPKLEPLKELFQGPKRH